MPYLSVSDGWLAAAELASFSEIYRDRSVLCVGLHGGEAVSLLLERGASRVVVVEKDAATADELRSFLEQRFTPEQLASRLDLRAGQVTENDGQFDVLLVAGAADLGVSLQNISSFRRHLRRDGWLLTAAPYGDKTSSGYYRLHDELSRYFAAVNMFAVLPLSGVALAPFGREEAEPLLDATLQGEVEPLRVVALAGPRQLAAGYGMVLLPRDAGELAAGGAELVALKASCAESEARLVAREQGLEELRAVTLRQVEELKEARGALDERDAYIAELERGASGQEQARTELSLARARIEEIETKERAARRRIAELEGINLRLEREQNDAAASTDKNLLARVAELEAQTAKYKTRAEDAQREAWAHMKARSDAEAAAAEVREDTVRKLKDARKIANSELMRAMEEATKKAVSLKEELVRTERERKEGQSMLKALREEFASLQFSLADLQKEKVALEEHSLARLRVVRGELSDALEQAYAERDQALTRLELAMQAKVGAAVAITPPAPPLLPPESTADAAPLDAPVNPSENLVNPSAKSVNTSANNDDPVAVPGPSSHT